MIGPRIRKQLGPCTGSGDIIGTEGDDVIFGSAGTDRISGLGGNDEILGLWGNDQLSVGTGTEEPVKPAQYGLLAGLRPLWWSL